MIFSAGSIPFTLPLINPELGSAEHDIECLMRGIQLARRILASPSFESYAAHERLPGSGIKDDAAIKQYVLESLATVHHPGGTCRMETDTDAVVDYELRVQGIDHY